MADIDEKRYTAVKVIPLKEGSVTVAYGNYPTDPRWHLLYENQAKHSTTSAKFSSIATPVSRTPSAESYSALF